MGILSKETQALFDSIDKRNQSRLSVLATASPKPDDARTYVDLFPLDANDLRRPGPRVSDQGQDPCGPPPPVANAPDRQPDASAWQPIAGSGMGEPPGEAEQPAAIGPCPMCGGVICGGARLWAGDPGEWVCGKDPDRFSPFDRPRGPGEACADNLECLAGLPFPKIPEGEPMRWVYRYRGEWTLERVSEPGKVILTVIDGSRSPAGSPKPGDVSGGEATERPTVDDWCKAWRALRPSASPPHYCPGDVL